MAVKILTGKDLSRISRANIVEYVLKGIKELEIDISLNELKENPAKISSGPKRKTKIANLIKLLYILADECRHEPMTGKLLLEAESLLSLLLRLKKETEDPNSPVTISPNQQKVNQNLKHIIAHLEAWRKDMLKKTLIPPGNSHVAGCYHPEYYSTYKFKPSYLPDDYRSNFFFEAYIKELCPFTTLIGFHPFSDFQSNFQERQSIELLTRIDINVELRDEHAIEKKDNLRGLRIHGPSESKGLPGSYIVVKGGHHRMRELFKKYLQEEVDGNIKVLIQLVTLKDFFIPPGEHLALIQSEIKKRHILRKQA